MSLTRTAKAFSLKGLAVVACALTAFSGMTIPTPSEAQVYRGRPAHMAPGWAGRPGFVPRAAYRPAFRGYRAAYGYRPVYRGYRPAYRPVYGGYRPAYGYRPWRAAYRPAYYPYRPAYYGGYGYRSAYYGGYGYGYPYGGYYRSYDGGGAVVAGLIGGLALGAIASAAARPAYRPATYRSYNNCFFERRRVVTRSGNAVIRRVRTCY